MRQNQKLNNDIILNVTAKSVIKRNILHLLLVKRLEKFNIKEKCLEITTETTKRNEKCENASQNTTDNFDKN